MAGLISYVKKAFKNYPDTTTKLSAENLNHLDNGIFDLDQAIGNALGTADISTVGDGTVKGAISTLNNDLTDYSVNTPLRNVTYYNGRLYQITSTGQRGSEIKMGMPSLDYTTPLHSFGNGSSYTATQTCYIVGFMSNGNYNSLFKINGITYGLQYGGASGFVFLKLEAGDVVSTDTGAGAYLHVLKER